MVRPCFLLALVALLAGAAPPVVDPCLIRKAGRHRLAGGQVLIVTQLDDLFDFRIGALLGRPGYSVRHDWVGKRGNGWFIYLESEANMWVYNGREEMWLYHLHGNGSITIATGQTSYRFDGFPPVPRAVAEQLPERIRRIVKTKD